MLKEIFELTRNVALVLPPLLNLEELADLPEHELEKLLLDGNHELFCLYFGDLMNLAGKTEYHLSYQKT